MFPLSTRKNIETLPQITKKGCALYSQLSTFNLQPLNLQTSKPPTFNLQPPTFKPQTFNPLIDDQSKIQNSKAKILWLVGATPSNAPFRTDVAFPGNSRHRKALHGIKV